jgi:hypothetical protein
MPHVFKIKNNIFFFLKKKNQSLQKFKLRNYWTATLPLAVAETTPIASRGGSFGSGFGYPFWPLGWKKNKIKS